MRELAGFALTFSAVVSYFVAATQFGLYQRWPIVHFLLAAAGCGVIVWGLTRRCRWWSRLLAALTLALALALGGFYVWYALDYSTYGGDQAPAVGTLLASELDGVRLVSDLGDESALWTRGAGEATLLVFYRGHW